MSLMGMCCGEIVDGRENKKIFHSTIYHACKLSSIGREGGKMLIPRGYDYWNFNLVHFMDSEHQVAKWSKKKTVCSPTVKEENCVSNQQGHKR